MSEEIFELFSLIEATVCGGSEGASIDLEHEPRAGDSVQTVSAGDAHYGYEDYGYGDTAPVDDFLPDVGTVDETAATDGDAVAAGEEAVTSGSETVDANGHLDARPAAENVDDSSRPSDHTTDVYGDPTSGQGYVPETDDGYGTIEEIETMAGTHHDQAIDDDPVLGWQYGYETYDYVDDTMATDHSVLESDAPVLASDDPAAHWGLVSDETYGYDVFDYGSGGNGAYDVSAYYDVSNWVHDPMSGLTVDTVSGVSYNPATGAYADPTTGTIYNPTTGASIVYEPTTGWFVDPVTGWSLDPTTYSLYDPATGTTLAYDPLSDSYADTTSYDPLARPNTSVIGDVPPGVIEAVVGNPAGQYTTTLGGWNPTPHETLVGAMAGTGFGSTPLEANLMDQYFRSQNAMDQANLSWMRPHDWDYAY